MNSKIQKLTGSFYTEDKVAESVVIWAIRDACNCVLEPSFGDGIFLEKALNRFDELGNPNPDITAVEIQHEIVENALIQHKDKAVRAINADFLSLCVSKQYDVVVGNPPYVGIKNLPQEQRMMARRIIEKHGARCPNNGSLWFPFVLHAITAIKPNGRLAFVLPFEITYTRYAYGLWNILSQNFADLTVCRIYEDFFPDVDVETVLLYADGKCGETTHVNYNVYNTVDDFRSGKTIKKQQVSLADIVNTRKPFISTILTSTQQQLHQRIREQGVVKPIIESCKFKIGYVSADKDYFHPNSDVITHYSIPKANLYPAILNAKELNGSTGIGIKVNEEDCKSKLYLPSTLAEGDVRYIRNGEALGVHQRYKCRQRKPWYITPNVEVPDVILSVFGEMPKMVANNGRYAVSNSLLCGRLRDGTAEQLICRWYNSLTLLSLELNVHSLGGGSFVIIPGEADRLEIASDIPQGKVSDIFHQIDKAVREDGVEAAYDLGDKLVLQGVFGLSDYDIDVIRDAIETLRNWRNPVKRRAKTILITAA